MHQYRYRYRDWVLDSYSVTTCLLAASSKQTWAHFDFSFTGSKCITEIRTQHLEHVGKLAVVTVALQVLRFASKPPFAQSLLVLPGSVWVRSKYGLLPQGVDVHIRLIGNAKLAVVVSVNGFYLYRPFHQLARPTWFVILTSTILPSTESEFQASRISLSTKCRLLIGQGVRRTGLFFKRAFYLF